MDKKNSVWITVRFLGLIYACRAIFAIVRIIPNAWLVHAVGVFHGFESIFLLSEILGDVFVILVAVYFLFFGGFVWRTVSNRTESDFAQSAEKGLSSLLVTMAGVWSAIKAFSEFYGLLSSLLVRCYISLRSLPVPEGSPENIFTLANAALLQIAINIIIFSFIAYYLIYRGGLVVRLLARLTQQSSISPEVSSAAH